MRYVMVCLVGAQVGQLETASELQLTKLVPLHQIITFKRDQLTFILSRTFPNKNRSFNFSLRMFVRVVGHCLVLASSLSL